MTKAYVQEFGALTQTDDTDIPLVTVPALANYVVDYTAAHAESPKFQAGTRYVEIVVDSIASVKFGAFGSTVAAVTDNRMSANERIVRGVSPPDFGSVGMGLSVVTNT
jgi:hypothetical protein